MARPTGVLKLHCASLSFFLTQAPVRVGGLSKSWAGVSGSNRERLILQPSKFVGVSDLRSRITFARRKHFFIRGLLQSLVFIISFGPSRVLSLPVALAVYRSLSLPVSLKLHSQQISTWPRHFNFSALVHGWFILCSLPTRASLGQRSAGSPWLAST